MAETELARAERLSLELNKAQARIAELEKEVDKLNDVLTVQGVDFGHSIEQREKIYISAVNQRKELRLALREAREENARLRALLDEAVSVIKFYAARESWDEIWVNGGGNTCDEDGDSSCKIIWEDVEIKRDQEGQITFSEGGKKAREFIAKLQEVRGE